LWLYINNSPKSACLKLLSLSQLQLSLCCFENGRPTCTKTQQNCRQNNSALQFGRCVRVEREAFRLRRTSGLLQILMQNTCFRLITPTCRRHKFPPTGLMKIILFIQFPPGYEVQFYLFSNPCSRAVLTKSTGRSFKPGSSSVEMRP